MFLFVLCTIFKYNQTNIKRFELPRIHERKDLTYSGFKSKLEEIEWRRSKVLELKSQGLDQREIAKILQVTPALISFDLQYPREEARKNVREYATKQLASFSP